jgi:malate synthase
MGAKLDDPSQFVGCALAADGSVRTILLRHHGLHVELQIDRSDPIGAAHRAGISDIVVESVTTVVADCEDSVVAVDAADKVRVYANWAALMQGELEWAPQCSITSSPESSDSPESGGGALVPRRLAPDRSYAVPGSGETLVLPGTALLLVRHVGAHMYTDAVTTADDGEPIPEGFLDAMVTALAAKPDLEGQGQGAVSNAGLGSGLGRANFNSRAGSLCIVKPKQHGSAEVAFNCELFGRVEEGLGLRPNALRMGLTDEERRTTGRVVGWLVGWLVGGWVGGWVGGCVGGWVGAWVRGWVGR